MRDVTQPTKEQVLLYLAQRRAERTGPPAPAEVRRRLGWSLLQTCAERPLRQAL